MSGSGIFCGASGSGVFTISGVGSITGFGSEVLIMKNISD
jgi:hypothetical protein